MCKGLYFIHSTNLKKKKNLNENPTANFIEYFIANFIVKYYLIPLSRTLIPIDAFLQGVLWINAPHPPKKKFPENFQY